jgi:subtilisin family serine protease
MGAPEKQLGHRDDRHASGVYSALKHIAIEMRDVLKRWGGKEMSLINAETAYTFQGRPVTKMKWNGKEVEVLQGMIAYRRAFSEPVASSLVAEIFKCHVEEVTKVDELGIGLITLDGAVDAKAISIATTRLGEGILWIEPVILDHGAVTPNDPFFSQQWALKEIKAEAAWDHWTGVPAGGSDDVVLAILDTGIPLERGVLSHPDLDDSTRFALGSDLIAKDQNPADDQGHGSHVTGIAAASVDNGVGMAGLYWQGTVLVIKVMDFNQPPRVSSETFYRGVLEAISFAQNRNARLIINYSGGGIAHSWKQVAVEEVVNKEALLVAAAGNNKGGPIDYPAAYSTSYSNVIAVGAIDKKRSRPTWASRGPELSVVAPGVDILSCFPNYRVTVNSHGYPMKYGRMDGTSMATPLVSALAALIWSKWPYLTAQEVRDKIIQSAEPIGSQNEFGSGMINAEAALL